MIEFYENLSPSIKASVFLTLVLMVLAVILGHIVAKKDPTQPIRGVSFFVVLIVDSLNKFIRQFHGKQWRRFAPILIAIFIFLLVANTAGLIGLETPLANINVAIAFSIIAFSTIQVSALIVRRPWTRIKDLASPSPLLFPVNVVSEISTPFAMGLRLFGNILSGSVIATIVFNALGHVAGLFAFTGLVHPIFNIGFGIIQAFVYFMLLTIFLAMAVDAGNDTAEE